MLTLAFEASRISAGISECVMSNYTFPECFEYEARVKTAVKVLELEELYSAVSEIEEEIRGKVESVKVFDLELTFEPFFYLVNRIVCLGSVVLTPELQFYACKNPEKVRLKLNKIRKVEEKVLKTQKAEKIHRINELEGELLGYPECCVKKFSKSKKLRNLGKPVKPPEGEIAEEFLKKGYHETLDRIFRENVSLREVKIPESLFAFNFYPCNIECKRAKAVGKSCKSKLEKFNMGELFMAGVVASMCGILAMCIKMRKINGKGRDYCYTEPEEIMRKLLGFGFLGLR